ncbi:Adenylyltransferase and sulfurtransferase uba4 [Ceratocystis lukuohia]|uniref:Adenylyltransferase and sulfurtransferase uba4 n=1 Tax=Ceratocystis lukuohia TaxID=2019550 RepID=A0ABR4MNT3_9PEZI
MESKEEQLRHLNSELLEVEARAASLRKDIARVETELTFEKASNLGAWPLEVREYERYGRQIIVPNVGVQGQLFLKNSRVLIVGVGGLGCPASAYLAGAGVGTMGFVDGDTVEASNLHRQIAHSTSRVGMTKVESAIQYLTSLNPHIIYRPHIQHLTADNAVDIISQYDIVLDCTDHPTSRYLVSDVCVLLQKPLIFASALKLSGQLMVMNYPPEPQGSLSGGPCYRCVFPKPSPPEAIVSCGDGGILGPVVGTMGVLQALEALKIITSGGLSSQSHDTRDHGRPSMLLFTANSPSPFRSIKMTSRRPNCFACGSESTLSQKSLQDGSLDYIQFCGTTLPIRILKPEERVTVTDYRKVQFAENHLLLDVRGKEHFSVGSLENAVNVPLSNIPATREPEGALEILCRDMPPDSPIYVICRQGEDSQVAVQRLKEAGYGNNGLRKIVDVEGGMKGWKREINPGMPFL